MGHPAHFHLFKNIIAEYKDQCIVLVSEKDILVDLLNENQINYIKISNYGKNSDRVFKFFKLIRSTWKVIVQIRKQKPVILIGCLSQFAWAGWLFRKKNLFFAEDDFSYTKLQGRITYPFVTKIITAKGVDVGPFNKKQITYNSYQKLAYLHKEIFKPLSKKQLMLKYNLKEDYFIIRLVNLSAHHDTNIKGIQKQELDKILTYIKDLGQILISSESNLVSSWDDYLFYPELNDMHSLMFHARGVISDSQSMTVESALLGTPNIRINDFKDKINILNELEYSYGLTKSFLPNEITEDDLMEFVKSNKNEWIKKKEFMFTKKINPLTRYYKIINHEIS